MVSLPPIDLNSKKTKESKSLGPTIVLGSTAASTTRRRRRTRVEKALDVIAAPLSQPKKTFTRGISAGSAAVYASRMKIQRGDLGEAVRSVGRTARSTLVAASVLAPAAVLPVAGRAAAGTGKFALGLAARHPLKLIFGAGLATTPAGATILKSIPEKLFKGGQIAGRVAGGEETGLTVLQGLGIGGLGAGAALLGQNILQFLKGKKAPDVQTIQPATATIAQQTQNLATEGLQTITGQPLSITSPQIGQSTPSGFVSADDTPVLEEEPAAPKPTEPVKVNIKNQPEINIAIAQ